VGRRLLRNLVHYPWGQSRVSGSASNSVPPPRDVDRAIVRLIVQRSVIELFAAYNVTVAPVPTLEGASSPVGRPVDHLVGMASLHGGKRRGLVTMSTSPAMLVRTGQIADDMRAQLDWMRELTNQLAGRIKNKFARYGFVLDGGMPAAVSSTARDRNLAIHRADLVLLFRTLRDQVLCTLSGGFDDTGLALQGEPVVADEGEMILF
jgi:hypothetical protein